MSRYCYAEVEFRCRHAAIEKGEKRLRRWERGITLWGRGSSGLRSN